MERREFGQDNLIRYTISKETQAILQVDTIRNSGSIGNRRDYIDLMVGCYKPVRRSAYKKDGYDLQPDKN